LPLGVHLMLRVLGHTMIREDIVIQGVTYRLSHLNPFAVPVTPKVEGAPTFAMRVSFGLHTFSKEWDASYPTHHKIREGSEDRCFCPIRHEHSLHLPRIIKQSVTGKVFFSQNHNYLIAEGLEGLNAPYAVFFKVETAKSRDFDVVMFVVSAYPKPNLPKNLDKITFATLVAKTARGEAIKRPKK